MRHGPAALSLGCHSVLPKAQGSREDAVVLPSRESDQLEKECAFTLHVSLSESGASGGQRDFYRRARRYGDCPVKHSIQWKAAGPVVS
jgi:hypothetical protein